MTRKDVYVVYLESESRNLAVFTSVYSAKEYIENRCKEIEKNHGTKQAEVENQDLYIDTLELIES